MNVRFLRSESAQGFFCCLASSLFYSFSLFLLRLMTNYRSVQPDWTLCVKESVTVFFVGLYILVSVCRGRYRFPPLSSILWILFAGFCCEAIGARAHLTSYAVIGLVLAGPLIQAFQLITAAALGAIFLKETLNAVKVATIVILIGAVTLLSLSPLMTPETASDVESAAAFVVPSGKALIVGVLLTLATGWGYATQIAVVRGVMVRGRERVDSAGRSVAPVPISLVMLLITGVGMISFGLFLIAERGIEGFYRVPGECWPIALGAGLLNLVGFYFQNKGIELIPASKVSLICVSQIFLLTVLGITFFGEPANPAVWTGLLLTVLGVLMAGINK